MILSVLIFATVFIQILGRPNSESDTYGINFDGWLTDRNMFLLPRILNVNDKINITINVKNITQMIEILLIAEYESSKTEVCSFIMDVSSKEASIHTKYGWQTDKMDLEHFLMLGHQLSDPEFSLVIQFKRRKNSTKGVHILQILSETEERTLVTNLLDNMRYLKVTGDNVKVSKIEFELN